MFKKIGVFGILLCATLLVAAPIVAAAEDEGAETNVSVTQENAPAGEGIVPAEEAVPAEETSGEGVITGEVTSLDITTGAITVKAEDGAEKAFSVLDGETILWKGVEDIKLADIKKGEKAEVGYYTDDNGKLIASWVDVIVAEESASTTTTPTQGAGTEATQPTPEASTATE